MDRLTREVLVYGPVGYDSEWELVGKWDEDELSKSDYDQVINDWMNREIHGLDG